MANFPLNVFRQITEQLDFPTTMRFYQAFNKYWLDYDVVELADQCIFLTHALYETNGLVELQENLNYSADRLLVVFPTHFNHNTAIKFAHRPQAIANQVYANRFGNGDIVTGDGWRYRGRGIFQTTFEANYLTLAVKLQRTLDDSLLEYLTTPEGAVVSACIYWQQHDLNGKDLPSSTQIIQGSLDSLPTRQLIYDHIIDKINALPTVVTV